MMRERSGVRLHISATHDPCQQEEAAASVLRRLWLLPPIETKIFSAVTVVVHQLLRDIDALEFRLHQRLEICVDAAAGNAAQRCIASSSSSVSPVVSVRWSMM